MAIAAVRNINYLLSVVSLMLYLLSYSEASSGIQEVRLVHTSPDNTDIIRYTVEINKPVNIIFENQDRNTKASCLINNQGIDVLINEATVSSSTNNETCLSVSTVSSDMSTRWICETFKIYCPNCYTRTTYSFEMHVKGARKPDVWIWGRHINTSKLTDRSVIEYDYIYIYEYEDGETIDYTCSHNYKTGKLRLEYYDANDNLVFRTDEVIVSKVMSFRPSMRVMDFGSYVDCIYIKPADVYLQEFTHRTKFTLKNKKLMTNYIVSINDTKLQLMYESPINGTDVYYYRFIPGEILKLSCEKTALSSEKTNLYSDYIYLAVKYKNGQQLTIANGSTGTFFVNTRYYDGAKLLCISYAKTSAAARIASIELHKALDRDPIILGLPEKGILYEYSKNENSWYTHYEYIKNQRLNLTCKSTTNKIVFWDTKDVPMQSSSNEFITSFSAEFYLNGSYNNAKIICEAKSRGVITRRQVVMLHQKLEALELGQDDTSQTIIIFACVSISLIAIITAICVFCWFKKIRNFIPKKSPYENFNNSESSIPAYLQDTVASSDFLNTNVNNSLYISSEDNRIINNIIENYYTEIADRRTKEEEITTLEYADPNKAHKTRINAESIENSYTEIADQRPKDNTTLDYAVPYEDLTIYKGTNSKAFSENTYAEIEENFAYENVLKRQSPYENDDLRPNV